MQSHHSHSKRSIAIIGSGIAGLSCAYHLYKDFNITVYEKEASLGGHTDTHTVCIDDTELNIDSGFIVFCKEHYPYFSQMLDELGVESQITTMSLSVNNQQSGLMYNATSLNRLFCQRRNLVNPRFYRMLFDIVRFYRQASEVLANDDEATSVSEYLSHRHYSDEFINDHLYPMISALWSATPQTVKAFPIKHLIDFLSKHGMMNLLARPEWRVVKNGSGRYLDALQNTVNAEWRLNSRINKIERDDNGVTVHSNKRASEHFDKVIFACHADQTLKLLEHPTVDEKRILGSFEFEKNHVVVHTDDNIMPPNKLAWASWNTEVPSHYNPTSLACCTANYWMNCLQDLDTNTNVFTSLNSHQLIDAKKVILERHYSHPIFSQASVAAQQSKSRIDGQLNSYFAGAYWGWGFHEDGARSGAEVSQLIKSALSPPA